MIPDKRELGEAIGTDHGDDIVRYARIIAVEFRAALQTKRPDATALAGMVLGMMKANDGQMQREADRTAAAVAKPIGCAKGCAFCCHVDVAVTAAELALFAILLLPEDRDATRLRAMRNLERRAAMVGKREGRHRIPCVFLEPGGVCGVYDIRPLACRSHFSLSRSGCEREWRDPRLASRAGRRRVPMPTGPKAIASAVALGMELALAEVGIPPAAVDLDLGLVAILAPGALDAWLAGDEAVLAPVAMEQFDRALAGALAVGI